MNLSPAQTFLAHNAVARLRHALRTLHALGVQRPAEITLPVEELECLAMAASAALGMDPAQFDVGAWQGPETAERAEEETPAEWHWPT